MKWNNLNNIDLLNQIVTESETTSVVVFKHSTRCSISSMALNRLEKSWDDKAAGCKPYYLDLINNRDISNKIAEKFHVHHESPQLLIIKNGECTYDASHMEINYQELLEQI